MPKAISKRQEQCLRLSATMSDKEIARELDISPHTVSLHIRAAMKTLGASNRRAALRSLAVNPYSGPSGIDSSHNEASVAGGHGQSTTDAKALEVRNPVSALSWITMPALLPVPPHGLRNRISLIGLSAFVILLIATSAMGLMSFVVESVGRLAVAS